MKKFFPQGGRQLFDGGLNSKYAPSIILDNESPDCLNVVFDAGAVETRLGTNKVNTTSVGSFAIDGIYSYKNNSNLESMCVFAGGLMYTLSGTTLYTAPSAQSVFAAGSRVASAQQENYIYFGNGATLPYKYNGAFTRQGVYSPTQTATVVSNGVGNLTASGNYIYVYSNVNTNIVEGNVGPLSATFTISTTSGQNTVSNLQTAPVSWGVNNIYLYRSKNTGVSPYYRLATLANGTTSFNDNLNDTALVTAAPTDNGVPPNYNSIVYAQGRLFCNDPANPNFVWYSNLNTPYTFGAQSFFRVGDNTSDLVRGVDYYNQSIVVYCDNSIWLIYMSDTTPGNWQVQKTDSAYGSKSSFGSVRYNNKLLFPAIQNQKFVGFAALSGNVLELSKTFQTVSTTGSDLKSDPIQPDMYQVQEAYLNNISAIIYRKKAWVAVTYGAGNTANNRVYQMDFSMSNIPNKHEFSWCPFTGFSASQFCVYQGGLYFGSSLANGFIYQAEQAAYADSGAAINSYYYTKEYVGDESDEEGSDTNLQKDFRYTNLLVDTQGLYNMNLTYKTDSDKGIGNVLSISLNPGGSLWGQFNWGAALWGGGNLQNEVRSFLASARGKRIQFKFDNQNTINQKFKVHGLNFLYNIKGYR